MTPLNVGKPHLFAVACAKNGWAELEYLAVESGRTQCFGCLVPPLFTFRLVLNGIEAPYPYLVANIRTETRIWRIAQPA